MTNVREEFMNNFHYSPICTTTLLKIRMYLSEFFAWLALKSEARLLSMSARGWPAVERQPLRHRIDDLVNEKQSCVLRHAMTLLYDSSRFVANLEANCCKNFEVSRLAPAEEAKIKGVKVACSMLMIRSSYCRSFWRSCRRYTESREVERFDCAKGLNTRTSKNEQSSPPPLQKPRARISRRAFSSQLVVRLTNSSSCNGCSVGSIATSEQTSESLVAK